MALYEFPLPLFLFMHELTFLTFSYAYTANFCWNWNRKKQSLFRNTFFEKKGKHMKLMNVFWKTYGNHALYIHYTIAVFFKLCSWYYHDWWYLADTCLHLLFSRLKIFENFFFNLLKKFFKHDLFGKNRKVAWFRLLFR